MKTIELSEKAMRDHWKVSQKDRIEDVFAELVFYLRYQDKRYKEAVSEGFLPHPPSAEDLLVGLLRMGIINLQLWLHLIWLIQNPDVSYEIKFTDEDIS